MLQLLSHDTIGSGFKTDSSKAISDEQENRALFMMAIEDPHCFEQRTYSKPEILYSCYDTWSCCLKIMEDTDAIFALFLFFCFLAHFPTAHSVTLGDISAQHLPLPHTQHMDPRIQMLGAGLQLTPVSEMRLQADSVSLITISHVSRTSLFTPNTPHDIQQYTRKECN